MFIKELTYVVASFLVSIPLSFPPDLCCFVAQWLPSAAIAAAPHPAHWPLQHRSERETPLAAGHGSLGTASRTESVGTYRSVPMGPGGSAPPLWGAGLLPILSGLVWRWKCWACATIQSPEHSLTLNETLWRHTKQPWTPGGQKTQKGYLNLKAGHKLLQVCYAWRKRRLPQYLECCLMGWVVLPERWGVHSRSSSVPWRMQWGAQYTVLKTPSPLSNSVHTPSHPLQRRYRSSSAACEMPTFPFLSASTWSHWTIPEIQCQSMITQSYLLKYIYRVKSWCKSDLAHLKGQSEYTLYEARTKISNSDIKDTWIERSHLLLQV